MKLLIIEPHASGHHAAYLRWIVEGCRARNIDVLLATTSAVPQHPLLKDLLSTTPGVQLRVFAEPARDSRPASRFSLWRQQLAYRSSFGRWTAQLVRSGEAVDAVLLPFVEYCFHGMALLGSPFGSVPWAGISMRLSALADASHDAAKWWLTRRMLRQASLLTLFCISPSIRAPAVQRLAGRSREKLCYLPDPAEQRVTMPRTVARLKLGLPDDAVAILVFGALTERKGIHELLTALRMGWPENLCVILAGAQDAAIRSLLTTPDALSAARSGKLIVRDFIHDDADEALVYAASDIAWLGYNGHRFMSGVLVASGRSGLAIIATREGEIGYLARENDLGVTVDPRDSGAVLGAIRRMLDPVNRRTYREAAHAHFADHTPERSVGKLLDELDTRIVPTHSALSPSR